MRTTDFDRLATSAPLNTDAAMARDGQSRDHWEGRVPSTTPHWSAPPRPLAQIPATVEDLTGRVVGRLTVIGYHGSKKAKGSQWLVRCACGDYELRSTKAITNHTGQLEATCAACDWLRLIKNRAFYANTRATREASALRLDEIAASQRGQS